VVGEELGFIGVTVALALFLFLFLRVIRVSERANDSFSSLVAFGLLASWFTHVLENVGMTLNLMPITGIPLPFFSYGGIVHAGVLAGHRRDRSHLQRRDAAERPDHSGSELVSVS
jgi:cell division protein FtsW (lipid II flippase)